jgi:hypothetical protein
MHNFSTLKNVIYEIHFNNLYSYPVAIYEDNDGNIPIFTSMYNIQSFISSINMTLRHKRRPNFNNDISNTMHNVDNTMHKRNKIYRKMSYLHRSIQPAFPPMVSAYGGRAPIKHTHTRTKCSTRPFIKVPLKRRIQKSHTKKYKKIRSKKYKKTRSKKYKKTRSKKYKLNKTIKK